MSGVNNFVRSARISGANNPPAAGQPTRSDRASAGKFKFSSRELPSKSAPPFRRYVSPTPESRYQSNGYHTAPAPTYVQPTRSATPKDSLDDTIVSSNFDKTISETHFADALNDIESIKGDEHYSDDSGSSSEPYYQKVVRTREYDAYQDTNADVYRPSEKLQNEPIQSAPLHPLRRQREKSPIVERSTPPRQPTQASGISGRFTQSQGYPIRNQQAHISDEATLKKPSPSPDFLGQNNRPTAERQSYSLGGPAASGVFGSQENGNRGDVRDSKTISPDGTPRAVHQPRSSQYTSSQASSDYRESRAQAPKRGFISDYSDEALKRMSYAQIEADTWEFSANGPAPVDNRPLDDRLQGVVTQIRLGEQNAQASNFFSNLSTAEWEESGEWFVDKFTDLMMAMREKRKERRVVTEKYEGELKEREGVIRDKSDNVDRMLKDMRASGEDMLRGKV
jgi:hypothetical protein